MIFTINGKMVIGKVVHKKLRIVDNEDSVESENRVASEEQVRSQIQRFMKDLDDDEFFCAQEIENFVETAKNFNLTEQEVEEAMHRYTKSDGIFYFGGLEGYTK